MIGYRPEQELLLNYDVGQMEGNLLTDTLQEVSYTSRIEYQLLQTKKGLLNLNEDYYKWSFLPTISAFINYNLVYQSNESSRLYDQTYPTSLIGLSTSLPIFTGTRRIQNLRKAQLLSKRAEIEMAYTRQRIDTEHKQAMANYKSALYEWTTVRNNRQVTERVYTLTKLQYEEGIKTYLELIIAESDLRTTELNYYNTLYRVLSSKLDLQKALGTVPIN
ncbi:MAG: TolC family protein [Pyrinomonadaceae bacterium]|nr:TolC family protein [Pyrinomonadaceae bacterium]